MGSIGNAHLIAVALQVSCSWVHDAYPTAKLYGSSRHHEKLPSLPWETALLNDPAVLAEFKDDLDLRIPAGIYRPLVRGLKSREKPSSIISIMLLTFGCPTMSVI